MERFSKLLIAATIGMSATAASAADLLALGEDGKLFKIDSETLKVTGTMQANSEGALRGIDVRPANGKIYALGQDGQLLTLDAATGATYPVAQLSMALPGDGTAVVDFNPVADRLRLLAADGTNFRVNVDTGEVVTDGTAAYAEDGAHAGKTPEIIAGAYTDSYAGTEKTSLYTVDAATSSLMLQNPPNDGVQQPVGEITEGLDAAAMDIASDGKGGNTAYLLTGMTLHVIDLDSGVPKTLGDVEGLAGNVIDIAVLPAQ
ncbi:MAG TPA: DUF4394 domain-containing protein [Pseudomonas xinjiangensis]|uniref:DUF4394 domain-containing protein n=2 Tax=root TaxID=1 RepID=A0A7V1BPG0_9GAMM|nr:DUF4394 domain-containing protein [Halopseudomonas xinjiangensis]HEC47353.1 DUF4394 domain-containing protein [Halopseudomonas xinjiangensis]